MMRRVLYAMIWMTNVHSFVYELVNLLMVPNHSDWKDLPSNAILYIIPLSLFIVHVLDEENGRV